MKIHMVSNCESQGKMPLVGIVLLVGPRSLQIGLDTMIDFLSFHDKIRDKGHPLARFNPVDMCMPSTAIENFKRCHLETLLITVVVREFSQWQTLVPTVLIFHHTCTEHILKHLVHTLCLTIDLRVISRTVDQVSTQRSMQLLTETSNELCSSVRDDSVGHPMQT
jgi:hypothetical protein